MRVPVDMPAAAHGEALTPEEARQCADLPRERLYGPLCGTELPLVQCLLFKQNYESDLCTVQRIEVLDAETACRSYEFCRNADRTQPLPTPLPVPPSSLLTIGGCRRRPSARTPGTPGTGHPPRGHSPVMKRPSGGQPSVQVALKRLL